MQATVESVSSSLIDRLDTHQYTCTVNVHGTHANRTGWRTHAHEAVCARQRRISYRPPDPARVPLARPVALLPELRRIVTRLDMPLSARPTHTITISSWRSKLSMSALDQIFY
ncbi:unnamed protein product [Pieris macdunnoughi]|uniref:Uncharacterized protein n=1 Tax=Pieris macdunnoughi TaxID=345717 RepID=A0A821UVE3_9NEOP|nr:unnamed protein product [Pieris macdunnoughi]